MNGFEEHLGQALAMGSAAWIAVLVLLVLLALPLLMFVRKQVRKYRRLLRKGGKLARLLVVLFA